jgi:hypothetical protein
VALRLRGKKNSEKKIKPINKIIIFKQRIGLNTTKPIRFFQKQPLLSLLFITVNPLLF